LSSLQAPELIDCDDISEALTFDDGEAILTADEAISLTDRNGTIDPVLASEINRQRFVLMDNRPSITFKGTAFDLDGEAFIEAVSGQTMTLNSKFLPLLADAYWLDAIEEADYIKNREIKCEEDSLRELITIHQELKDSKLRISMSLLQRQRIFDYMQLLTS
jgi:hypothetical protein